MKKLFATTLCAVSLAAGAQAEPKTYELDPEHTTVAFIVQHVGYAGTLGQFGEVSGEFTYDADTRELSDVRVSVATDSVTTLNKARDKHVRGNDFLGVRKHPEMVFTASSGKAKNATSGTVNGQLTLLGQTKPLALDVKLNKSGVYPFGHKRFVMGITARGTLNRSDFGMNYGVANGLVGDQVQLIIETEGMQVK